MPPVEHAPGHGEGRVPDGGPAELLVEPVAALVPPHLAGAPLTSLKVDSAVHKISQPVVRGALHPLSQQGLLGGVLGTEALPLEDVPDHPHTERDPSHPHIVLDLLG